MVLRRISLVINMFLLRDKYNTIILLRHLGVSGSECGEIIIFSYYSSEKQKLYTGTEVYHYHCILKISIYIFSSNNYILGHGLAIIGK